MRTLTLKHPLELANPVLTVGTFDGVHRGHLSVLEAVRALAKERGGPAVAVTFDPHPRSVIDPSSAPGVLTSLAEKEWRLRSSGLDVLGVVPFAQDVRNLSPEAFTELYLVRYLNAQAIVVGYDHGFGKGRSGDLGTMQELGKQFGFEVFSVPPVLIGEEPISSTRVRTHVLQGEMEAAQQLLGAGYVVAGQVIRGDGRGAKLGFPTANLALSDPQKLLPPNGVFAARVYTPEARDAVLNLGVRPTFDGQDRSFEVHILNFDGNLYGSTVYVEMIQRIRPERKFESPEALVQQVRADCQLARDVLSQKDQTLLWR
ncbi:MAG: bifunctional riboflavin kinase/FAD synthetase [bacterium]|nr:bifunctional riboflavin kinase/FAD synthetase [bacterium]